jgi:hypothetical protein
MSVLSDWYDLSKVMCNLTNPEGHGEAGVFPQKEVKFSA